MIHTWNVNDAHAIAIIDAIELVASRSGGDLTDAEEELYAMAKQTLEVETDNAVNRLTNDHPVEA